MTDEEFRALAAKCEEGTASVAEQDRFDRAYQLLLKRHETWDSDLMGHEAVVKENIFKTLSSNANQYRQRKSRFKFYKYAAAAALIFSIGVGSYFYYIADGAVSVAKLNPEPTRYVNDIEPGSNKAILTLADGRTIDLKGDKNGIIIQADKLTYNDGTEIGTNLSSKNGGERTAKLNTISIPQGGQYQVQLADGTQVWLNAASSLTYPTNLNELRERKVTLKGEAYFEVAKDDKHPFIVETAFQQVGVLGTHFNVYAYEEEKVTKTTLLEGAVRISPISSNKEDISVKPSILLQPNQQSILVAGNAEFQVGEVDVEEAIAWQRGYFMFSNEPLESVMNKIARWYDVKVVFNDASLRKEVIYGTVSRSEKASGILKKLELTGELWFEIKDATIYVFKKN